MNSCGFWLSDRKHIEILNEIYLDMVCSDKCALQNHALYRVVLHLQGVDCCTNESSFEYLDHMLRYKAAIQTIQRIHHAL